MIRRALIATGGTAFGVALLLLAKPHQLADVATTAVPPTGAGGSAGASAGAAGGKRVVEGDMEETRFGPVQVALHLDGRRITSIDVLQEPDQSPRDMEIGSYALPQLDKEAMAAQNAKIDAVSGATYTSDGYIQSLQSALDRAGA